MLSGNQANSILLPTSKGIEPINTTDIIRIEAVGRYSKLFFNNGNMLVVDQLLNWFEQHLPTSQFIRIHREHLINKSFIRELYSYKE
jgi:two-component system, LytTR family, response regulator